MYHSELFHHVENFLKKVLGGNKSQIFFIGAKMRGVENGGGLGVLGDVNEAGRPVLRGLEVMLQILRRSEVIFARIIAPLHPLPRSARRTKSRSKMWLGDFTDANWGREWLCVAGTLFKIVLKHSHRDSWFILWIRFGSTIWIRFGSDLDPRIRF